MQRCSGINLCLVKRDLKFKFSCSNLLNGSEFDSDDEIMRKRLPYNPNKKRYHDKVKIVLIFGCIFFSLFFSQEIDCAVQTAFNSPVIPLSYLKTLVYKL